MGPENLTPLTGRNIYFVVLFKITFYNTQFG